MFYAFLVVQFILFVFLVNNVEKAKAKIIRLEKYIVESHEALAVVKTIIDPEKYPELVIHIDSLLDSCDVKSCNAKDIIAYGEVEIDETPNK